jgi:hypothetical protein
MLKHCLENIGEGLFHACISSYFVIESSSLLIILTSILCLYKKIYKVVDCVNSCLENIIGLVSKVRCSNRIYF